MTLEMKAAILKKIHAHEESTYPEEGAGLLLGEVINGTKRVTKILSLTNTREESARHDRYLLGPNDYAHGEEEAERLGLEVLGVFHSHPDHPNVPSEFDREWAWPWFSYLITSVWSQMVMESRSWQLAEDRSRFVEERVVISET
jgi:proteasome lid subunit RPN8/RPN11